MLHSCQPIAEVPTRVGYMQKWKWIKLACADHLLCNKESFIPSCWTETVKIVR